MCPPFPLTLARSGALVLRTRTEPRFPLKGTGSDRVREMDPLGFEPRASSLQRRHSTAELWALP